MNFKSTYKTFRDLIFFEYYGKATIKSIKEFFEFISHNSIDKPNSKILVEAHATSTLEVSGKISLVSIFENLNYDPGSKFAWVSVNPEFFESARTTDMVVQSRGFFMTKSFLSTRDALAWLYEDEAHHQSQEACNEMIESASQFVEENRTIWHKIEN